MSYASESAVPGHIHIKEREMITGGLVDQSSDHGIRHFIVAPSSDGTSTVRSKSGAANGHSNGSVAASHDDPSGKLKGKQSSSQWLSYLAVAVLVYLSWATYPPSLAVTQVRMGLDTFAKGC